MISIPELYQIFLQYPRVSTDTRNIQKGDLFFALKGGNFNGNKFASDALKDGAAYAIIDEPQLGSDERMLLVHDVLTTLQDLAHHHRVQLNPIVIALTGSNGKTTSKELLHRVLSTSFETLATQGNLNNHIGVPLTLLRLEKKHTHAIIEMGANHRHEIEALCEIAQPNYGFITNIGKAHLEGFGGELGVAKGKTELYYYLYKHEGTAFVNIHEEATVTYSQRNQCVYFSGNANDYQVARLINATPQIEFEVQGATFTANLGGNYNFNNMLFAIAAGKYFGIDAIKTGQAVATYLPQNMRHQWITWNSNNVLLDAYNANPDSMLAALQNFRELKIKGKIVILGDMFELGSESKDQHQIIINDIDENDFEAVYLCGNYFASSVLLNGVKAFATFEELQSFFNQQAFQNKTILIKGSRGMQMERLIK